jgi:hypothetical protein
MPQSAAPCVKRARLFLLLLSLAVAGEARAQVPDTRDALIDELRQRIEALEKRLEKPAPLPPSAPVAPAPAPAAPPAPAAKPVPTPSASVEQAREDEGARALERTLVREGGLVLPKGSVEFEPRVQYTYRGSEGLRIATVGGVPRVVDQDVKRNELEASVGLRIGLPWSLQAEARLPYAWLRETRATSSALSESDRASGWGDLELGLTKQLLVADRGRLGVLGSLNWKSVTGHHELGRLSAGSGFPLLQAALTAVKREDPLVFFGTASYTRIFERDRSGADVDPGDAIGIKAGTLLAASPETSLRTAIDLTRFGRTHVGGSAVPGSDATVGILELGLSTLLTRRTLLDVNLGIGITPDAPDFRVRLAVPIRF